MHKLPFFFFLNRKREREGLAEFSEAHMGWCLWEEMIQFSFIAIKNMDCGKGE